MSDIKAENKENEENEGEEEENEEENEEEEEEENATWMTQILAFVGLDHYCCIEKINEWPDPTDCVHADIRTSSKSEESRDYLMSCRCGMELAVTHWPCPDKCKTCNRPTRIHKGYEWMYDCDCLRNKYDTAEDLDESLFQRTLSSFARQQILLH